MPPKRKAAAKGKGRGGKKVKVDVTIEPVPGPSGEQERKAIDALKTADKGKKMVFKVDAACPYASSAQIVGDFDCMLNQTNIGNNNNKFYIIQVLQQGSQFYAWNRWGRVGESGQNAMRGPFGTSDNAIADFKKKFKDKTKNDWDKRSNFNPVAGKYTLIEMDTEVDEKDAERMKKLDELDGVARKLVHADCQLDKPTQTLMKLIFDNDMFKEAMAQMEIDVKKMPLGKISKGQIAKGFDCLEDIEAAIKNKQRGKLADHSSRFYTLIPHSFGRQRPPIMGDLETVRKKKDMLLVLGDIEVAQGLMKEKEKKASMRSATEMIPHPMDANYDMLNCDLSIMDKKEPEFKVIEKYLQATEGYRKLQILDVWRVDRSGEEKRFADHTETGNRKLLWHGTNVAVVAAILKGGLRIMPHSGGRVGRGIYFASENGKSAAYVRCAGNTGIMFLNEVVLGKEHHITMDDWRLTEAPPGYDCIIAKGRVEPDPKKDTSIKIEGNKVTVPQGKPINMPKFASSNFSQSEYLVYKESQARIRYMLKLKF